MCLSCLSIGLFVRLSFCLIKTCNLKNNGAEQAKLVLMFFNSKVTVLLILG